MTATESSGTVPPTIENGRVSVNCPPYAVDPALWNHAFAGSVSGTVVSVVGSVAPAVGRNRTVAPVSSRLVLRPTICTLKPPVVRVTDTLLMNAPGGTCAVGAGVPVAGSDTDPAASESTVTCMLACDAPRL